MKAERTYFRDLYKKLLGFYPKIFRERFGESMEQTFNDLYMEKQQTQQGLFGFTLWTFTETVLGIAHEHITLITEVNPMKSILTDLKMPAVIGSLIILPFILLEFTFVIIKQLTFDLRDALDSVVIFGILWLGVTAIALILMPLIRTLRAGHNTLTKPASTQGNTLLTNPTSASIISLILAAPFVTLLTLLVLGIEPPLGPLAPLLRTDPDQPNYLSLFIVLGVLLLAVAAGLIARTSIMRTLQAGGSLLSHPLNLILATVILFFVARLVIGLAVDQFPCWIGVPNCD